MFAFWLALLHPAAAVETVPTTELASYLEGLRTQLETETIAIGYSGYDNEERLKTHVEAIPFVMARRLASQGEPEKLMKGLMKKSGATCGFVASGGGRNITLLAVGTCEPEYTEEEIWAAACRADGLEARFPGGDATRFETLRPTLPTGVSQEAWDAAMGGYAVALASCSAAAGDIPDEARLTIKLSWAADGTAMWGKTTPGGAPDHIASCAEKVAACLPNLPEGDGVRSVNQVVRVLPPTASEDAAEASPEDAEGSDAP